MKLNIKLSSLKKYKYELLVLLFFVLVHLPDLGNDMFNTDVWKWKSRSYDFSSGVFNLDFEKTIQKYHPGVTLMWAATLGIKVYNLYYDVFIGSTPLDNNIQTVFELHFVQKLFMVTAISIVMVFVFHALRKIANYKLSLLFIFLFSLEPLNLALTRELHLEGMMTAFMLASYLWFLYFISDKSKQSRLVLSAVFGAYAVLTKTTSLFIIPFIGLLIVDDFLNSKGIPVKTYLSELTKKTALLYIFRLFFTWLVFFILFFIIFWPAMWVTPLEAVQSLYMGIADVGIEREHEQLYFGNLVSDPGVSFYFVVVALKSSIVILFGALGVFLISKKIKDKTLLTLLHTSLLFSIFYFIELTIPGKKLDRYILPVLSGLTLSASVFYCWLFTNKSKFRPVLALVLFITVYTAVYIHPNYFSYYNPLFGGLKKGMFILEPKWTFGQQELEAEFNLLKNEYNLESFSEDEDLDSLLNKTEIEKKMVVAFPEKYYTQLWPFIRRTGGYASIMDIAPHAVNSGFVVYPVWDDQSNSENRVTLQYIRSIELRNVPIYNVYKIL